MGEPPPGMWLDRIDNDGNYAPKLFCWTNSLRAGVQSALQMETSEGALTNRQLLFDAVEEHVCQWITHFHAPLDNYHSSFSVASTGHKILSESAEKANRGIVWID